MYNRHVRGKLWKDITDSATEHVYVLCTGDQSLCPRRLHCTANLEACLCNAINISSSFSALLFQATAVGCTLLTQPIEVA